MYFRTWSGTSFSNCGFYVFFHKVHKRFYCIMRSHVFPDTQLYLQNCWIVMKLSIWNATQKFPKIFCLSLTTFQNLHLLPSPLKSQLCINIVIPAESPWLEALLEVTLHQHLHHVLQFGFRSLQCSQNVTPWASISFSKIGKNHGARSGE
jgi:hypothetical protein